MNGRIFEKASCYTMSNKKKAARAPGLRRLVLPCTAMAFRFQKQVIDVARKTFRRLEAIYRVLQFTIQTPPSTLDLHSSAQLGKA
jgi:hypothetical protein